MKPTQSRPHWKLSLALVAVGMTGCFLVPALTESLKAPPGEFNYLDDAVLGEAKIIEGKQLFVDDELIAELRGARKVLNQPKKHPRNPLLVKDKPWEESGPNYGSVVYDPRDRLFKMWYETWKEGDAVGSARLMYATSRDGITWQKPLVDKKKTTNQVSAPDIAGFQAAGIYLDAADTDPRRRFKMLFSACPDKTAKTWRTSAATSPDGLTWTVDPKADDIPFSDTQSCPLWDPIRKRYVAILRYGPPNTRIVSRTESEDFRHWSPKVTILQQSRMEGPKNTQFYQMAPFRYGNYYFGLVVAYHDESLKPPPPDRPWTDRKDLQLVYSRNGVTWQRVVKDGALHPKALQEDRDWMKVSQEATFIPYGVKDKDWDWGILHPYFSGEPLIVDNEIRFYYFGWKARNWWTHTGDPPKFNPTIKEPFKGVGLATLRLDGFVFVEAEEEGTMTTRPFVFLGDTLVVNANASGGSLRVEALTAEGQPITGFTAQESVPVTTDGVEHVLGWKGQTDAHLLQARPIRLRFHLSKAKLYSFAASTRNDHYLQSYD